MCRKQGIIGARNFAGDNFARNKEKLLQSDTLGGRKVSSKTKQFFKICM